MRLDLGNFGEIALISIYEGISAENVPVIMAGVRKVKETNPAVVVLDLSQATPAPGALSALKAVRSHPGYAQLGLKMVSPLPEISDFPDLKAMLGTIKSKIVPKVLDWQKLSGQVALLRKKEKEAADKMGGKSLSEDVFTKLVSKNKALKKFNITLSSHADAVLKTLRGLQMDNKDFGETKSRYESALGLYKEIAKVKGLL